MNIVDAMGTVLSSEEKAPLTGVIVQEKHGSFTVRTPRGTLVTAAAGSNKYSIGDRVRMSNGVIVERVVSNETITTYVV